MESIRSAGSITVEALVRGWGVIDHQPKTSSVDVDSILAAFTLIDRLSRELPIALASQAPSEEKIGNIMVFHSIGVLERSGTLAELLSENIPVDRILTTQNCFSAFTEIFDAFRTATISCIQDHYVETLRRKPSSPNRRGVVEEIIGELNYSEQFKVGGLAVTALAALNAPLPHKMSLVEDGMVRRTLPIDCGVRPSI